MQDQEQQLQPLQQPQKENKFKNFFRSLNRNRFANTNMLIVVVAIAAIGGFMIFRSRAATVELPTGQNDLVLEYKRAGSQVFAAVPVSDIVPIKVYRSGLAICGNDAGSANKDLPYYQKQLTESELRSLVDKVVNTGFLNYTRPYTEFNIPGVEDSIKLNLKDGLYEIPFGNFGQKPQAYKATEDIVKSFCSQLTEPYIPGSTTVFTKKVTSVPEAVDTTAKPAEVAVNTNTSEVVSSTVTGDATEKVVKELGRSRQGAFKHSNKLFRTSVYITLPAASQPAKAKNISKNSSNKASAASTTPVQYTLFCPKQPETCTQPPRTLGTYAGAVQGFYKTQAVTRTHNLTPTNTVYGANTSAWYKACHQQWCRQISDPECDFNPGSCPPGGRFIPDTFLNSFININEEKKYYKVVLNQNGTLTITIPAGYKAPALNTHHILGYSNGKRTQCGQAIISGTYSLVDLSNIPSSDGYCNNHGNNEDQSLVAHELGHTFGMAVDRVDDPNGGLMNYQLAQTLMFPSEMYLHPNDSNTLLANNRDFHTLTGDVIPSNLTHTLVYARNSGSNVTAWWNSPILGKSSWNVIGANANASVASNLSTATSGRGDLRLFARSNSGSLIHSRHYDFSTFPLNGWTGWNNLGGPILQSPASVSWGPNRYDVFVRGTDNMLYQKFSTNNGTTWSGFVAFGNTTNASPAVSSWGKCNLAVFIRNNNNAILVRTFIGTGTNCAGSWSAWKSLGGNMSTGPSAVSWGPNHIEVFAINASNKIVRKSYNNGTWTSTWQAVNTPANHAAGNVPSVISPAVNQLTLFSRSATNTVLTSTINNGVQSGWTDIGGAIQSAPAAAHWR